MELLTLLKDAESSAWTDDDRAALDAQIDEGLAEFAAGGGIGEEELRRRLAASREERLVSV